MKNKKLVFLRDCDGPYDYSTDSYSEALCDGEENKKKAIEFLKDAIVEAGFEPRKKVDHHYSGIRVFIKGIGGGKYFLQCATDFDSAGSYDSDDEIEIDLFTLSCSNYVGMASGDAKEYASYKDIVKNLARDLNMNAGNYFALSKGDSKKLKAA